MKKPGSRKLEKNVIGQTAPILKPDGFTCKSVKPEDPPPPPKPIKVPPHK
jgi:hypothetical protein